MREWNRLDEAAQHLTQGIQLCRRWNLALAMDGYVGLARVRYVQGDLDGMQATVQEMEQLAGTSDMPTMDYALVAAQYVRLLIAGGDLAAATRWARDCGLRPDGEWTRGPWPYVARETVCLALVRVLLAQGEATAAGRLLASLRDEVERLGRVTVLIELLALQVLVQQAAGQRDAALADLERALLLAEPEGFLRTFLDEGAPLAAMLRVLVSRQSPAADYARRLLAVDTAASAASPAMTALAEPLSERELEVLHLVAEGLSNREIADRLVIGIGTVKTHINNVYGKLGVHSRTRALARAAALGLSHNE